GEGWVGAADVSGRGGGLSGRAAVPATPTTASSAPTVSTPSSARRRWVPVRHVFITAYKTARPRITPQNLGALYSRRTDGSSETNNPIRKKGTQRSTRVATLQRPVAT